MSDVFNTEQVGEWAREGGVIAKRLFNNVHVRRKADASPVTEADEQIEQLLIERISAAHPDHGILGEESARRGLQQEYVWAVDPIDGTDSFVSGLPTWCISIGLLRNGMPYAGAVYLPLLDDLYTATPAGAWLNGEPLGQLAAGEPAKSGWISVPSNAHRRFQIQYAGKTRSLGSLAVGLCYVARGSAEGMVFSSGAIWDLAAGLAIVRAVGGEAYALDSGTPIDTGPMLNGRYLRVPMVVAEPARAEALRQCVRVRG